MKSLARWLCAAIVIVTFTGCDDGSPVTPEADVTPTKDGRPAGFEDMMKGMEKDMKKSTTNPEKLGKSGGAPK